MARTKCTGKRGNITFKGVRKQVVFASDSLVKRKPTDGGVCVCSLSEDKTGQGDCPYCSRYKRAKRREIYNILLELASDETDIPRAPRCNAQRNEVIDLTNEVEEVSKLKKRKRTEANKK